MANNQLVIKFSLLFYTVFMLFDIFASFFIIINIKTRKKIRKSSNKKTTYSYMWNRQIFFFDKLAWIFFNLFLCHFIYTDIHINHFSIWPIMILCVIIWIYVNNWRPEAIKIDIYCTILWWNLRILWNIVIIYG